MLRLFPEQEQNERVFSRITRFLDLLDELEATPTARARSARAAFQLKLLWLAGYLPHTGSCAECGADGPIAAFSPRAGGVVCR